MRRFAPALGFAQLGLATPAEPGAWTLPRGQRWFRIGFMFQETEERYFLDGRRIPYFFEGQNSTEAAFFDLRWAPRDRLEIGLQIPFFRIEFDDLANDRTSTGIGDVRLGARYNLVKAPLVVTTGATVKFSTGDFENDAEVVPVGEGQYDVEVFVETGRSFWPRPGYVTGMLGFRVRTVNAETGIDHGNELVWSLEGGTRINSRVSIKGVFRGLHGFTTTSFGLPITTLRRGIGYVQPGVVLNLGPDRGVEFNLPVSVWRRNWPAGVVVNVGYFQRF